MKFGIVSDILGQRDDIPSIKLPAAYASGESEWMHYLHGAMRKLPGRRPEFLGGVNQATFAVDVVNLAPGASIVELPVYVAVENQGLFACRLLTQGTPSGIDDDNTVVLTLAVGGNTILTKTYNAGRQPPTNDQEDLTVLLSDTYADLTDGDVVTLSVTQGPTANMPAFILAFGSLHYGPGTEPLPTPDGRPVLRWHYHVSDSGTEHLHAFTGAHVYRWSGSARQWKTLWTCSAECVRWSTATVGPYIVATNDVDKVLYWDDGSPGTAYAPLGDPDNGIDCGDDVWLTRAEYVIECEGYVFLMATTENGKKRAYRRRWCSWGDLDDWDSSSLREGDAGWNDLERNRRIMGCGISTAGGTRLVTFTQNLVNVMWLTESDLVWESETLSQNVGCAAPDTIVNDSDGNLYYLGTDLTIRVLGGGSISKDQDRTIRNLNTQLLPYAQAAYVSAFNELWWAVPWQPDSTGNDLVLIYNVGAGTWHKAPMDICAFGGWTGQTTYTIDTIPFPTIDGIEWPFIDWAGQTETYPFLIASDYAGYGYRCVDSPTDKGTAHTGRLVLATDLANRQAATEFKRVHGMWLFFEGGVGNVAVSVQEDDTESYSLMGAVTVPAREGQVWLPCDTRFRHAKIKLEGSESFDFIGLVADYDWDGDA